MAVAPAWICDRCHLSQSGFNLRFCQRCGQPLVGTRVGAGRIYRLDRFVAEGYSSTIWHAVVEGTGEARAVKVLLAQSPEQRQFAVREAELLRRFRHPRLPQLFEAFDEAGGDLFMLVLDYVDGPTMRSAVEASGPLPLRQAIQQATELAAVLGYLACENLVHLDLHPKNVILHPRVGAILVDFGVAELVGSPTKPGGRAGYFAPEILDGSPATPANDVYALAGCLYFALTSEDPSEIPGVLNLPSRLTNIPNALVSLLLTCRHSDPRGRPSIAEVRRELRAMRDGPDAGGTATTPLRPTPLSRANVVTEIRQ